MPGLIKLDFGKKEKNKKNTEDTEKSNEQKDSTIPEHCIIHNLPVSLISPNPLQPRVIFEDSALFSLAHSIHEFGMIQPITVRDVTKSDDSPPSYEIISGERRLRAAMLLNLETVPCVVIDVDMQTSGEMAIIENLQREDLNFFEQASALQKLIELFSYTQDQAAKRLSVSQSYIANKLRLLKLTPEEQSVIIQNGLTERHARTLIRINDPQARIKALAVIINRAMNVTAAEKYIKKLLSPEEKEENRQHRTFILKDIRLFLNSIDKAVDLVSQSGINIKTEKIDKGEFIEVSLIVPKNKTAI